MDACRVVMAEHFDQRRRNFRGCCERNQWILHIGCRSDRGCIGQRHFNARIERHVIIDAEQEDAVRKSRGGIGQRRADLVGIG
jgi:hypothetical protein